MRQPIVMGNWKMNGSIASVSTLVNSLLSLLNAKQQAQCVLFPPAIYVPLVQMLLKETGIGLGAQNVYPLESGAVTGELCAPMLVDYGCRYVLVGHSERRHIFGEDEHFIAKKFHHVKDHAMIPVLCVGETLTQREEGLTQAVIAQQLRAVMESSSHAFEKAVIAYEPVWAIGTGKTASAEQAQEVHAYIRSILAQANTVDPAQVNILYGGSVNEQNAKSLFAMPDVDGGLVGGASLNARQFVEIIKCIS